MLVQVYRGGGDVLCHPPSAPKPQGGGCRAQTLTGDSSCVFSLNFKSVRVEVCHKRTLQTRAETP